MTFARGVGRLLLACALLWSAPAATAQGAPAQPTCDDLIAALPLALETASEVVVAVSLEQGGRELAFERSRVLRASDGSVQTEVIERRGLRRPDGTGDAPGGDGPAPMIACADHEIRDADDGGVLLRIDDADPDAPVPSWSLRFAWGEGRWLPLELIAEYRVRVLFVPVRGRFVTTFEGWRFDADVAR